MLFVSSMLSLARIIPKKKRKGRFTSFNLISDQYFVLKYVIKENKAKIFGDPDSVKPNNTDLIASGELVRSPADPINVISSSQNRTVANRVCFYFRSNRLSSNSILLKL